MHQDYKDLLSAFQSHGVKYLVVGGLAVIYHAQPRFTKDTDLSLKRTLKTRRLYMRPSSNSAHHCRKSTRKISRPECVFPLWTRSARLPLTTSAKRQRASVPAQKKPA